MTEPSTVSAFKSKTLTVALAFLFGGFGAHRFYLHGFRDRLAWCHVGASLMGLWGVDRLLATHLQSGSGWLFATAGYLSLLTALLTAIVYGLRPDARWDAHFNRRSGGAGNSGWTVILIVMAALLVGSAVLLGGIAVAVQTYYEAQVGQAGLN